MVCTTRYSFLHNHALSGHQVHRWVGEDVARCSRHPTTTATWQQLHQVTMESSRKQNGCPASYQSTLVAGDVRCDVDSITTDAVIHCHNTRNQTNHTFSVKNIHNFNSTVCHVQSTIPIKLHTYILHGLVNCAKYHFFKNVKKHQHIYINCYTCTYARNQRQCCYLRLDSIHYIVSV